MVDDSDPFGTENFDTNVDPTTASMSKGLAAVNKVLAYGRQSHGLPAHGVARFGGSMGTSGALGGGGFTTRKSKDDAESSDQQDQQQSSQQPAQDDGSDYQAPRSQNSSQNSGGYADDNSYNGDEQDSGADDSGDGGDGGDYAKGGLVRDYEDGGEVDDTPDEPTPQEQVPASEPMDNNGENPFNASSEAPAAQPQQEDQQEPERPWYSQDNGMMPVNAVKHGAQAIMDYLHGAGGASKQEVDAAMRAAEAPVPSTPDMYNQMVQQNDKGLNDDDPFDTQNDPDAPAETPSRIGQRNGNGELVDATAPPTPPATISKYDQPESSNPNASDSGFTGKPNETPASDSGFTDSTAVKAVTKALDENGEGYASRLMQGMRKLVNSYFGYGEAAAKNGDLEKAANAFNKGATYLPGNEQFHAVTDGNGVTVKVTDAGKVTTHELTPEQFSSLLNPGTGMQFDKVLHKGPSKVIDDHKAQSSADPFNTGVQDRTALNRSGAPAGVPNRDSGRVMQSATGPQGRTGPVRYGRMPERGYYDDNGTYHKQQDARDGGFRQDRPDNTDPRRVTMFAGGRVTNGQGEELASDDPRTKVNRDARQKLKLEQTKSDAAYDRAELGANSRDKATEQRGQAASDKNATTRQNDEWKHADRQRQAEIQQQHFDELNRYRATDAERKYAEALIKQNGSITGADALLQAKDAIQKVQGGPGGPQAPQPQAPQAPTQRPPNVPQGAKQYKGKWYTRGANGEAVEVK